VKNEVKEKISWEIIRTLVSRFELFPEDAHQNRNAPFHEAFLQAFSTKLEGKVSDIPFFISLSSWLHGLNTTLGQSFFEKVAHILSDGEKREFTSKKIGNLKITREQKQKINRIITELSNGVRVPNVEEENSLLFYESSANNEQVNAIDFSTDVFFEDKDRVVAIELKSVRPNSGEMRGEKQKILEGKAALSNEFPRGKVFFYIGFPFDPTSDGPTDFDKTRFLNSIINMTKYFAPEETLLAGELWDFLSGEHGTMEDMLKIINDISTPQFMENFQFLNDTKKRNSNFDKYKKLLQKWYLFSELELIENNDVIRYNAQEMGLTRFYNQKPFNTKGQYNFERYVKLKGLIGNPI